MGTHQVLNQPPPLEDYDLYASDPVLWDGVEREAGSGAHDKLSEFGRKAGSAEVYRWGFEANVHEPVLQTHDRFGHRIDEVEFHPSWHRLMALSVEHGLHSLPFEHEAGEGSRVVRDVAFTMISQVEAGHGCPISMTTSVLPALRANPELARVWERRILTRTYDGRSLPVSEKAGALFGMGMTEKQGGSDVRANTTVADPTVDGYRITGHKWFTSAPMCDAFLILAQAPHGITCLLLPRFLPDGSKNQIRIQRLKDKLGNRSNASAELEFEGATAFRVGDEGRGIATIIEMVNNTRLDCVVGSTGLMRQAVAQAGWHSAHRRAFGANLIDKPLMQNVLADLELEVEAATMIMLRLSGAFDRADTDPAEADFRRVATPVAKYWATKRCTPVVRESLECLGGNGYVEESILPRLFRESPVNAIWEGSGNVIALDLLRVLAKQPAALHAMVAELDLARGADKTYDAALDRLADMLGETGEAEARRAIEALALTWAASLLLRHGDEHVADAYVRTRLGGDHGALFGTLPADAALPHLASRTIPRT